MARRAPSKDQLRRRKHELEESLRRRDSFDEWLMELASLEGRLAHLPQVEPERRLQACRLLEALRWALRCPETLCWPDYADPVKEALKEATQTLLRGLPRNSKDERPALSSYPANAKQVAAPARALRKIVEAILREKTGQPCLDSQRHAVLAATAVETGRQLAMAKHLFPSAGSGKQNVIHWAPILAWQVRPKGKLADLRALDAEAIINICARASGEPKPERFWNADKKRPQ